MEEKEHMKYSVIYADPPWSYRDKAKDGERGASHKYTVMSMQELVDLRDFIDQIADKNCALFMWATFPMLPEALSLLKAWNFKFRTVPFVWVKTNGKVFEHFRKLVLAAFWTLGFGKSAPLAEKVVDFIIVALDAGAFRLVSLFWGMGHWTRCNAEIILLGTRGSMARVSSAVHQVILAPVGEHSTKPAEARQRIVDLMGDLSRIELFARGRAPGWEAWGNELPKAAELNYDIAVDTEAPLAPVP